MGRYIVSRGKKHNQSNAAVVPVELVKDGLYKLGNYTVGVNFLLALSIAAEHGALVKLGVTDPDTVGGEQFLTASFVGFRKDVLVDRAKVVEGAFAKYAMLGDPTLTDEEAHAIVAKQMSDKMMASIGLTSDGDVVDETDGGEGNGGSEAN